MIDNISISFWFNEETDQYESRTYHNVLNNFETVSCKLVCEEVSLGYEGLLDQVNESLQEYFEKLDS